MPPCAISQTTSPPATSKPAPISAMISNRHSPRPRRPTSHCHLAASRSASRTTSMCSANPAPADPSSSPKITSHPTKQPSSANSAPPVRFLSAASTWTNSPWARRRKIPRCKRPATPTTTHAFPVAHPVAPPPPWPIAPPSPLSARTPVAQSANQPRTVASSGSSRPTAASHATASSPSPLHSTRSDHSRKASKTQR